MSHDPRVQEELDFIETCVDLELLASADAQSLSETVGKDGQFAAQAVLQRGLLTQADVDIVQSLRRPTEVVPGYKILDLIGRGGMGVVYRAEQLDLEKTVALKTILISNVHDPTAAARFEREAKSLARLQHPNIVQALNFGKHEGRYYFAMEFVAGQTCEQALREVKIMHADRVWPIVRQVASGLMHALKQNLVHRDIKPANLLLLPPPEGSSDENEIVKIADFGLAMFADQSSDQLKLTTGDKMMGSPAYMSLEQFGGRPVDFRSDMYALGATAWHLLFGTPPFTGPSVAALYQQKRERISVDPSTLPVVLPEDQMRLLIGLLDPDPDLRPQSYEQLIDAINALGVCQSSSATATPGSSSRLPAAVRTSEQLGTVRSTTVEAEAVGQDAAPNDMAETIALSNESVLPGASRFKWLIALAVLGLLGAAIAFFQLRGETRGARTHTQVVGTTPLFDGVTLSGWDVGGSMVGAWNTVEAPDSSTAIACTTRQGALTRRFPETANPRISLFVWLQPDGGPIDVDFAFDPSDPTDVRASLRMSSTSNQIGAKASDFGELEVMTESDALPTVHDRYHVIHIERQPTDWYIFFEEKLLGTVPISRVGDGDAIRLVVHGSTGNGPFNSYAFFADVQLYELAEAPAD